MAVSKALGLAVLLAAAALLAATATAVDDEHIYHLKCFTSCNTRCQDEEKAAAKVVDGASIGVNASISVHGGVSGAGHKCKKGCLNECFVENYPALCYQECVTSTCLCKPPYSKEKMECMKMCCDKCFHHGPAPPMPPRPTPPMPPKPTPPKPSPPKPTPPKPSPPVPSPPKPSPPKPTPPKPSPPVPKPPSPPKPPRPPCPPSGPGGDKETGNIKN
ncbi:hypothetical protein QOZ80_1BG0073000 [Eleusine coracana subsp. coracana]|nr:hypothetical protein QOZ80_1BG0073000 [Eleusine coracana subsp. coracana]